MVGILTIPIVFALIIVHVFLAFAVDGSVSTLVPQDVTQLLEECRRIQGAARGWVVAGDLVLGFVVTKIAVPCLLFLLLLLFLLFLFTAAAAFFTILRGFMFWKSIFT